MHISFAGKKIRLLALAVTIFMIIFVSANWRLYLDPTLDLTCGTILFVLSLLAGPVAGFLIIFKPSVDDKYKALANTALFFIMPVLTIQMVEVFNENYIWWFSVPTFLANYMIYLVFYLFFIWSPDVIIWIGLIVNISLYVWSLLNYFIELFRGSPFVPLDVLSFGTGLSVSDGYTYELSWKLILGSIMFFLILSGKQKKCQTSNRKNWNSKLLAKLAPAAYIAVVVISLFFTDYAANLGYKPDFWDQSRGYHRTGSFFNFCLNTKYLIIRKPSDYNAANVSDYVAETLKDAGVDPDDHTVSTNLLTGQNDYTANADAPCRILFVSWMNLCLIQVLSAIWNQWRLHAIHSQSDRKYHQRFPVHAGIRCRNK